MDLLYRVIQVLLSGGTAVAKAPAADTPVITAMRAAGKERGPLFVAPDTHIRTKEMLSRRYLQTSNVIEVNQSYTSIPTNATSFANKETLKIDKNKKKSPRKELALFILQPPLLN